jgi:hypothetical protein
MHTRLTLLLSTCAVALIGIAGCHSSTSPTLPVRESNPYYMAVQTAEGDATRHLLSVGDTGFARLLLQTSCPGSTIYIVPCFPSDGWGVLSSSDRLVMSLMIWNYDSGPTTDSVGHAAQLVGRTLGSVQLSYSAPAFGTQWRDSVRVDVVAAPLPVDSVRVRLGSASGTYNATPVSDAAGNLVSVTLVSRASALGIRALAFRGGDSTVYLLGALASSDTTVAWVSQDSLPLGYGVLPFRNRCCHVFGPTDVSARSPGTATVTLEARNQRYSFLVTVQ